MYMKTAIITGSTGAIGKAIARQVLAKGNYNVIIVARDEEKAEKTLSDITRATGLQNIVYKLADLSRKEEIFTLAAGLDGPVHLLVNNAAQSPRQRLETQEGIEVQWATNVLGYFWMIQVFSPLLEAAGNARIVNVASYWAGNLDLDDPEFRRRRYDNDEAYRQSKQADRMLTVAFAERLKAKGITVNSCHPGDVNSKLSNDLGFGGHETPDQGADTPVWLATSPEVEGITGKYFAHRLPETCVFSRNRSENERLYNICQTY
jgi:NAD(P)-dependent dehydrogenase (short-subunit alcohol dehydrogenase family)